MATGKEEYTPEERAWREQIALPRAPMMKRKAHRVLHGKAEWTPEEVAWFEKNPESLRVHLLMVEHARKREAELSGQMTSASPNRPTMEKMYRVATGQAGWTPDERAWLEEKPERVKTHERLRESVREFQGQFDATEPGFAERIVRKPPENEGRTRG